VKPQTTIKMCLALCGLAIVLSSCGTSQDQLIQTAIAKTQAAATPTSSPEQVYVQAITPVLTALDNFASTTTQFEAFVQQNNEVFQICDVEARGAGVWKCDLISADTNANAIALTQQIMNGGFDVKSSVAAITPPASLRTSHSQISDCIDLEVDRARYVNSLVAQGIATNMTVDPNSCGFFPNALAKIKQFVQQNK
jgi:hypothetical protein